MLDVAAQARRRAYRVPVTDAIRRPVTTITDVARAAGVSPATVSRALNGSGRCLRTGPSVSARRPTVSATCRPVRRARCAASATRCGPRSSPTSRTRSSPRSSAASRTSRAPKTTGSVLCNSDEDVDDGGGLRRRRRRRAHGRRRDRRSRRRPSRACGRCSTAASRSSPSTGDPRDAEVDSVVVDNRLGGEDATAHLVAQGATRVACITGPSRVDTANERLHGYRDALAAARPDRSTARWCAGPTSRTTAAIAPHASLLEADPAPDALFVANDPMTVGALRALRELGPRVPDDVADRRLRRLAAGRRSCTPSSRSWPSPRTRSAGSPATCSPARATPRRAAPRRLLAHAGRPRELDPAARQPGRYGLEIDFVTCQAATIRPGEVMPMTRAGLDPRLPPRLRRRDRRAGRLLRRRTGTSCSTASRPTKSSTWLRAAVRRVRGGAAHRVPRPALRRGAALRLARGAGPRAAAVPRAAHRRRVTTPRCGELRSASRRACSSCPKPTSRAGATSSSSRRGAAPRSRGTRTRRTGSRRSRTTRSVHGSPLDDVDVDNGCLWFVPGSHKGDVLRAPPCRRRPVRAPARARGRGRHVGRGAGADCPPAA